MPQGSIASRLAGRPGLRDRFPDATGGHGRSELDSALRLSEMERSAAMTRPSESINRYLGSRVLRFQLPATGRRVHNIPTYQGMVCVVLNQLRFCSLRKTYIAPLGDASQLCRSCRLSLRVRQIYCLFQTCRGTVASVSQPHRTAHWGMGGRTKAPLFATDTEVSS